MMPLGSLGAGFTAARFGAPATVVMGGLTCVLGAAVFARRLPEMRGEALELLRAAGMHVPRQEQKSAAEPPGKR
jgi:hypothetical protein